MLCPRVSSVNRGPHGPGWHQLSDPTASLDTCLGGRGVPDTCTPPALGPLSTRWCAWTAAAPQPALREEGRCRDDAATAWRTRVSEHRAGGPYLHGDAEVYHGHAGVAVPAHVHHGVAAVRGLALQRRARRAQVVLRLLVGHRGLIGGLCGRRQKAALQTSAGQERTPWGPSLVLSGTGRPGALPWGAPCAPREEATLAAISCRGPTPGVRAGEPLTHLSAGVGVLSLHADLLDHEPPCWPRREDFPAPSHCSEGLFYS